MRFSLFVILSLWVTLNGGHTAVASESDFWAQVYPDKEIVVKYPGRDYFMECKFRTDSFKVDTSSLDVKVLFEGKVINQTYPDPGNVRVSRRNADRTMALILDDIKDKHSGNYTCVVSFGGHVKTKSFTLVVNLPIEFHSSENQHGVLGTDGSILCEVTRNPQVLWRKGDGTPISNGDRYIIMKDRLVIKDLRFSDTGKYICDATVNYTEQTGMLGINFVVDDPPVIIYPIELAPAIPRFGDDIKIYCNSRGLPAPSYTFTKNDHQIPEDQIDATSGIGILTIKDLNRTDEAVYTCIATNSVGRNKKSTNLRIKRPSQKGLCDGQHGFSAAPKRTIRILNKKLKSQQKLTVRQNRKLNRLTQKLESFKDASNTYAFSAAHVQTDQVKVGKMATMMFSEVLFNIGDAYNATSGVFTAPRKGVYMFHLNVRGNFQRGEILLQLQGDDGEKKVDLYNQGLTLDHGKVSFNVLLQEGGWVKPSLTSVTRMKELTCCQYSVFTGFLLNAL